MRVCGNRGTHVGTSKRTWRRGTSRTLGKKRYHKHTRENTNLDYFLFECFWWNHRADTTGVRAPEKRPYFCSPLRSDSGKGISREFSVARSGPDLLCYLELPGASAMLSNRPTHHDMTPMDRTKHQKHTTYRNQVK